MPQSPDTHSEKIRVLNERLQRDGVRWRAKDTPISRLHPDKLKRMLGWAPAERARSTEASVCSAPPELVPGRFVRPGGRLETGTGRTT